MGMPFPEPITTIEELLALPADGLRHELLDGEHVMTPAPSPRHQRCVLELATALRGALADDDSFEVLAAPADIRLSTRTLVQPDLFVVRSDPENRFTDWAEAPIPHLVIEVLSPSTAARDRSTKRRLYLEAGVQEYWIVDLDARAVERWRRGDERPEILEGALQLSLSGGVPAKVDLPSIFRKTGT